MLDIETEYFALWRDFANSASAQSDLVLRCDHDAIRRLDEKHLTRHHSWAEVLGDTLFGSETDGRLHLGLVPQPFIGNPLQASVIILLLNPGVSPADFHAEFTHAEFKEVLFKNLRGELWTTDHPFFFLDPQWAWTGGYTWWFKRLRGLIHALEDSCGGRPAAQKFVAQRIAAIELVPYHSQNRPRALGLLNSSELAKRLARRLLEKGKKLVVARQHDAWQLGKETTLQVHACPSGRSFSLPLKSEKRDTMGQVGAGDFILEALRAPQDVRGS